MESSSSAHNICVAVDGSEASHTAFEVVTQTLLTPKDQLLVAHVFNKDKTYLPFNMQPDNIRQTYESLISGYGAHAKLLWEQLDPRLTTKEHVLAIA
jgi:nucleotide-binding universal stress UspA family protein